MSSFMKMAVAGTTKQTTQAFDNSRIPGSNGLALMLLVGLCFCIVFLLFIHIADWCLERHCRSIEQQRRASRADQRRLRRLRAAEPLPTYIEQDPMGRRPLDPHTGAQSPPPAYYKIVIPQLSSDWQRMRHGCEANDAAVVLPPPYLERDAQALQENMLGDVVYMV
ncbi:hypothetical protein LX36DRAFT_669963 [Colletotrichum falcatum]|nr:hypothetical protein LX36DRAFT_669963 [Colletotrichum falcatum]